ncbi:MAG: protein kinase [Acidobacteriota bacterium]|nr:protein kinase [Acidobacteriota bacterium]MDQ3417493.1 protein kinase [Acidobacteriota bacterium]
MGEVYRARDPRLNREVAVKALPASAARDAERVGRFEREAQILAALNHPHIAALYGIKDVASADASSATRFIVLELLDGARLPIACAAVRCRCVRPWRSHVRSPMRCPRHTTKGSSTGMVLGTAAYMSPEQARALPTDRRADIWSLGCVLYEMLAGQHRSRPPRFRTLSTVCSTRIPTGAGCLPRRRSGCSIAMNVVPSCSPTS